MKSPARWQYWVAGQIPWLLLQVVFVGTILAVVAYLLIGLRHFLGTSIVLWIVYGLLCLLLGVLVAMIVLFPFAGPILAFFVLLARANGAPFSPGDRVRILVGPFKDQVSVVKERRPEYGGDRIVVIPEGGAQEALFYEWELFREA